MSSPASTKCSRCGGIGKQFVDSVNTIKWECGNCHLQQTRYDYSRKTKLVCPCGSTGLHNPNNWINLGESGSTKEEVVSAFLCDKCTKEIADQAEIVKAGGLFWRCKDCGSEGVIKPEAPICATVRKQLGLEAPALCGYELDKAHGCPACGGTNEEPGS